MYKKLLSVLLALALLAGSAIAVPAAELTGEYPQQAETVAAEPEEISPEAEEVSADTEDEQTAEDEASSARELFEEYKEYPRIANSSEFELRPLTEHDAYEYYTRLYGEEGFARMIAAARDRFYSTFKRDGEGSGLASTGASADIAATGAISWSFSGSTLTVSGSGAIEDNYDPWYEYSNKITTLKVGEGITVIGEYVFNNLDNLTSVQLPSTLRVISDFGFIGCDNLKSITLPEGLQEIGERAFTNCVSLEAIRIPDSVTKLGSYAFEYCRKLSDIYIGSSVSEIGENPFCQTYSTTFKLGSSSPLKVIDGVLFDQDMVLVSYPCQKMDTSYTVPDGTTAIGADAITPVAINYRKQCYLTNVTLPETVTKIGFYAFSGYSSLKTINFPSSLKVIDNGAFYECSSLERADLPEGLEAIEGSAFSGCSSLTYFKVPDSVIRIGRGVLHDCNKITVADIGDGPEVIDGNPFYGCASLTEIRVDPSNGFSIINNALFNPDMELIAYPVGKKADTYYIPDGTTAIGESAFEGGWSLSGYIKKAVIPDSVISIGDNAFDWSELKEIVLGKNVEEIGIQALEFCEFTEITLPDSLTRIGYEALSGCTNLKSITLSKNVESIGYGAFSANRSLTAVNVASANPFFKSVNGILYSKDGTVLYQYPDGKTDSVYNMPNTVETVKRSAVFGNNYLEKVVFSNKLKNIEAENFSIYKLSEVVMPDSLVSISWNCFFYLDKIETVTLGKSLSQFNGAFSYCKNLKSIYFTGNQPDDMQHDFSNTPATVYYPKNDSTWNNIRRGVYNEQLVFQPWDASTHNRTDISSASVSLSATSYTYDGTEKKPSVTVKHGSNTLMNGIDYSVTYTSNINAGTAGLTVEGIGDYYGTVTRSFTISKASQTLTAYTEKSELAVGEKTNIRAAGIGSISYSADTPTFAEVSSSGVITAKSAGTARITVSASGSANYYSDSKTLTLKISSGGSADTPLTIEDVTFGFTNSRAAFGYPIGYRIPLESYKVIHSNTVAKKLYERNTSWNGNCYGFHVATALFNEPDSGLSINSFNKSATRVKDLKVNDYSSDYSLNITRLLEAFLSVQYDSNIAKIESSHINRLDDFLSEVEKCNSGGPAVGVGFRGAGGHEITAYGLIKERGLAKVKVYNNWFVGEEEYLYVGLDSNGRATGEWNYRDMTYSSSTHTLDYITYYDLAEIWANRKSVKSVKTSTMTVSSENFVVRDSSGEEVARMTDGEFESFRDDIIEQTAKDTFDEGHVLYLPTGEYTVKSYDDAYEEPLEVSVSDVDQSASVVTQSDEVTLTVDDVQSAALVSVNGNSGEEFKITLDSETDFTEDNGNIIFKGKSDGDEFTIGTSYGRYVNYNYTEGGYREDGTALNLNNYNASYIQDTSITMDKTDFAFTGSAVEPEVRVTDGYGHVLTPEVDYTIVYTDNVEAGTATATVYGINNYKGKEEIQFNISPVSISAADVRVNATDAAYNGNEQEPGVTVSMNGVQLIQDTHYTVSYSDNIETGTASVTVNGAGSLSGSVKLSFRIYMSDKRLCGDVNCDNEVDINDATFISRHLAGYSIPTFYTAAADVDGNNDVNITDVTLLQRWIVKLSAPDGIGKEL